MNGNGNFLHNARLPPSPSRSQIRLINIPNEHTPGDEPHEPARVNPLGTSIPRKSAEGNGGLCALACDLPIILVGPKRVECETVTTEKTKVDCHGNEATLSVLVYPLGNGVREIPCEPEERGERCSADYNIVSNERTGGIQSTNDPIT